MTLESYGEYGYARDATTLFYGRFDNHEQENVVHSVV